jgi:hypothetical protein
MVRQLTIFMDEQRSKAVVQALDILIPLLESGIDNGEWEGWIDDEGEALEALMFLRGNCRHWERWDEVQPEADKEADADLLAEQDEIIAKQAKPDDA